MAKDTEYDGEEVGGDDSPVKIPEKFQKDVYDLLDGANSEMLDFVCTCCRNKQDALREQDMSEEGMPSD